MWLASPFWKAAKLLISEQINRNIEDLTRGDIGVRNNADEGMLYRTDDALRGGIVAMTHIVHTLPDMLIQELEVVNPNLAHAIQEEEDGE